MQTFLPLPDLRESLEVLDYRRLGKQRLEARQILDALAGGNGWSHHPAVKMWRGFEEALTLYMNLCIQAWVERGYRNTMKLRACSKTPELPPWWGDERIHSSHRARLLDKLPTHYRQFGWTEQANPHGYWWPEIVDGEVVWKNLTVGREKKRKRRRR